MKDVLKCTAIALAALAAGCGSEDTASDNAAAPPPPPLTTQDRPPESPAEEYALKKSGGKRTGCSSAKPGADSESNPGCIYTAALAGCAAAHEGEPDPSKGERGPVETDFHEPGLIAIMARAYKDCSTAAASPQQRTTNEQDSRCARNSKTVDDYDITQPGASRKGYLTLLHQLQANCPEEAERLGLTGAGLKQCTRLDQESCTMYRKKE